MSAIFFKKAWSGKAKKNRKNFFTFFSFLKNVVYSIYLTI